jgi:hypothetical protein
MPPRQKVGQPIIAVPLILSSLDLYLKRPGPAKTISLTVGLRRRVESQAGVRNLSLPPMFVSFWREGEGEQGSARQSSW